MKRMPERDALRAAPRRGAGHRFLCDRCGAWMEERNCKVVCPNCGGQIDCSDLTIHLDELEPPGDQGQDGG